MSELRADELSPAESGATTTRTRRPLVIVVSIVIGVAVLVGLFFVVDLVVRGVAERRVSEEIVSNLPENVTATPTVSLGGASVIAQYLAGTFDDIKITAPDAVVDGIPVDLALQLNGFPVDTSKPVAEASGTAVLSQQAVNDLIERTAPNSAVELGQGELSYAASATFLGFTVGYRVTGEVEAAGDSVLVAPTGAEVTAGGGGFDLSRLLSAIVGADPISVCTARYLPVGVSIADIDVKPRAVTVQLEASDMVFSQASLQTLGSCSQ